MVFSEEQAAALEAEVAAVLDILEALAGDGDSPAGEAAALARYASQVERIALAAGAADLLGLQDVCLL